MASDAARRVLSDATEIAHREQIRRSAALLASVRRAHYDASIAQGFTAEQALEICIRATLALTAPK